MPERPGVDRLQAEPEPVGAGEVLLGAGEDDQALALGEVEELGDVGEVALGQVRQRRAEDEPEPAAGRGTLAERARRGGRDGRRAPWPPSRRPGPSRPPAG